MGVSSCQRQPTRRAERAGIKQEERNVTPNRDKPVTSLPVFSHVHRLGKEPHFYSPGSPGACSGRYLARSPKGFEDFADRCKRRSTSLSFSRSTSSSPSGTAGKTTLLQILAGKKLIKGADVTIKGLDVFHQFPEGLTWLGTEWYVNASIQSNWVRHLTRFQGHESCRQERHHRVPLPRLRRWLSTQRAKGSPA